ncbi:MAG: EamA family transporter [Desulfovibrionaceae bacterium]|nr:EamA family transporter [Desulfovibrionaceae bacterium]
MKLRPRHYFSIFLHLFLVYISWGTSYLGFSLSLEVLGPFFSCGFRMAFGGFLLCLFCRITSRWRPIEFADIVHALKYGFFMVVAASGFLCYGQQYVSSGVASIITGSTPITMILASWLIAREAKPDRRTCIGLIGGSFALLLLSYDQCFGQVDGQNALYGVFWILMATFGWVAGSLLLRHAHRKNALPALQDCGLLLFVGGLESLAIGLVFGEGSAMHFERLTVWIALAFAWMVIGGAILAYSSYFWLLRHVSLSVAVSYEYVVPVIALFLGWWLLDERLTIRMLCAAFIAISSVVLVMHRSRR